MTHPTQESNAVRFNHLSGGYGTKVLFHDVRLDIPAGRFTSIIGPNGAGKSTLLKYLVKVLLPQTGTVYIADHDVSTLRQRLLARHVAMVAQNGTSDYEFTVFDSVAMGRYAHIKRFSSLTKEDRDSIEYALEATGIRTMRDKLITELSGGEAQRVLLARALCQDTDVIALDEPINHLDPFHQRDIMRLLRQLVDRNGLTVICVLHALDAVQVFSDHVVLMHEGRIVATGTPRQVLTPRSLKETYRIDVHEVTDPATGATLLLPTW
ncbi:MAG: ABC transporter ATP-binding protein [Sphaerochaetaceae bacterium]|jgi:iron complex transport system ATP-binding protein